MVHTHTVNRLLQYLLFLVEVCEYRKASFASELGTPYNDRLTGGYGNIQVPWICLTHLENQTQNIHTLHTQNILADVSWFLSMGISLNSETWCC